MSYHIDKETNEALIRLLDSLCEFERNSGRRSTLILIPHNPDEEIVLAQDGKPLPPNFAVSSKATYILNLALMERDQKNET